MRKLLTIIAIFKNKFFFRVCISIYVSYGEESTMHMIKLRLYLLLASVRRAIFGVAVGAQTRVLETREEELTCIEFILGHRLVLLHCRFFLVKADSRQLSPTRVARMDG